MKVLFADYFNDVFSTFLGLESGKNVAVYGEVRGLSDFIKKTFILCSKYEWRSDI